jgi:hypothetical protein
MTRALAACLLAGCYTAAPPSPPAPAASPPARTAPRPSSADEALCCCTFKFAEPEDPDVAKWDSLATRCATGGGGRFPGQCIAWSSCGYAPGTEPKSLAQRPDLRPPPPLAADECCCYVASTSNEDISVKSRATCDATPNAACVGGDFCDRDDP